MIDQQGHREQTIRVIRLMGPGLNGLKGWGLHLVKGRCLNGVKGRCLNGVKGRCLNGGKTLAVLQLELSLLSLFNHFICI